MLQIGVIDDHDKSQHYIKMNQIPTGMPIRQNRYDFHQESHFYVDILTKGGDLCQTQEDGTYVIVSDGSDQEDSDEAEAEHERAGQRSIRPPMDPNSQFRHTQGQ